MKGFALAALLLASANSALAGVLRIHNWDSKPAYFWMNNDKNSRTVVPAGATIVHNYVPSTSTSLKFTTVDDFNAAFSNNILQFEYTSNPDTLWYDLSNINGSPFLSGNQKISPTGAGANSGNCAKIRCPANQKCVDAYNAPHDDWATKACPASVGDLWLDLMEPTSGFNSRSIEFSA